MTLRSLRPSSISSRHATRLAVALALGCAVSTPAYALRLAHSRIVSAANAPLQVLVGIAELTPDEQRTLMVSLADPAAWQAAGVTPPVPLSSMTLRLEGGSSPTRRNLRVSSTEAAKSPVVDLLLNLGSSEGKRQVQVSMMQSVGGFRELMSQAQVGGGARPARGAGAVAVRPGDTLYGIAQSNAVADATLYQMLVALWRANPNAFIQNNMNLVKAGATLVVPDAATVRAIDPAEARRIFIQQQEAYARYRASLAGAAARGAAVSGGSTSAGQVSGPQSTATPETPPQDRLRLSSGEPGQGGTDAQAQAQADTQTSMAKATEDAKQRVDQLERNVKDLNEALAARGAEQGKGGSAQGGTAGANGQGSGLALPGLAGAAGGASASAGNAGNAGSASRAATAQSGTATPPAGTAQPGGASSSATASQPGAASQPGPASQSNAASQPGATQQPGAMQQPGATPPAGAASPADSAGGVGPNGSRNGSQAGADSAGPTGADSAKPGISGDASALGGTSGTSAVPGSAGAAASGASAGTGGAATGGTGISPSGGTSPASPSGTSAGSGQAGAATGTGPAITAGPGNAATDEAGANGKARDAGYGLPSWLSDNLLIILTAVLAVVAFVIAWLLRRAAVRRDEDQDDLDDELYMSEIDQGAIDRRLDGINLDLDEPPAEGERPRPGPVRT